MRKPRRSPVLAACIAGSSAGHGVAGETEGELNLRNLGDRGGQGSAMEDRKAAERE
jgi:hypothetical protein